jgi:prepilin-type N-terminal cleavage/methylation domain-containing protein
MMMNYKKLKNGFSMAELLVALSIFAIISTMGLGAFSYMVQTQYKNQIQNEKDLLREAKISSCIKEMYYSSCTSQNASCNGTNIKNDCINKQN